MNRHRRKTAVAALLLLGASLVAVGSVEPWAKISGPHIGVSGGGKTGRLGFDFVPQLERSGDPNSISILLVVAAVIALCAIAVLVTRVRRLEILCRIGALAALVIPVLVTVVLWKDVTGDPARVLDDPHAGLVAKGEGAIGSVLEHLGLLKVQPGPGLWLLTAACLVILLGVLIPV